MTTHTHTVDPVDRADLRARVQGAVDAQLGRARGQLAQVGPELAELVDPVELLMSGGKRLRAAFCYWGYRGVGGVDGDPIVRASAGLEFFQAAALLHDDVMDGSDTRRGQPALHRRLAKVHAERGWSGDSDRFGEAAAILAGDLCLAWSEEMYSTSGLPAEALGRGRGPFDLMRTQLMGGQYLDVLEQARSEQQGGTRTDMALRVVQYKSAKYTVEHPLLTGAALGGASPATAAALSAYGLPLGEAFQLRDDVLGVFGDPAVTGKPAGDDIREGKRTVLVAQVETLGSAEQRGAVLGPLGQPHLDEDDLERVRAALVDSGALAAVERMIGERAEAALAALDAAQVEVEAGEVLAALVESATDRQA